MGPKGYMVTFLWSLVLFKGTLLICLSESLLLFFCIIGDLSCVIVVKVIFWDPPHLPLVLMVKGSLGTLLFFFLFFFFKRSVVLMSFCLLFKPPFAL